jgi:hypothetical protein
MAGVDLEEGDDVVEMNWGDINGYVSQSTENILVGGGNDIGRLNNVVINDSTGVSDYGILAEDGNDKLYVDGVLSAIDLFDGGAGDDFLELNNGNHGTIQMGLGDDHVQWLGGTIRDSNGDDGSDRLLVQSPGYSGTETLDGGDDYSTTDTFTDTLIIDSQNTNLVGASLLNWENIVFDNSIINVTDGFLSTGTETGTGITLMNNSQLTIPDTFTFNGNLDIQPGSLITTVSAGPAIISSLQNSVNSGDIDIQNTIAGDDFTIMSNYNGQNGQILMDMVFGDSSSVTDVINITGDASGTTVLNIENFGGTGALTTGNGIPVVTVTGVSDPNAFTLSAPIVVGNFEYVLVQADAQNWYLQSLAINAPSSSGGRSSVRFICKDEKAVNYNDSKFGRHKESLCEYETTAIELSPVVEITSELVPNIDLAQCPIFTQYMKKGDRDGSVGKSQQNTGISSIIDEIQLLQSNLNDLGFNSGPVDGIFGQQTEDAVNRYQIAHRNEVLDPWNLPASTGWFYQSSERWMNELLGCRDIVTLDNGRLLQ